MLRRGGRKGQIPGLDAVQFPAKSQFRRRRNHMLSLPLHLRQRKLNTCHLMKLNCHRRESSLCTRTAQSPTLFNLGDKTSTAGNISIPFGSIATSLAASSRPHPNEYDEQKFTNICFGYWGFGLRGVPTKDRSTSDREEDIYLFTTLFFLTLSITSFWSDVFQTHARMSRSLWNIAPFFPLPVLHSVTLMPCLFERT